MHGQMLPKSRIMINLILCIKGPEKEKEISGAIVIPFYSWG